MDILGSVISARPWNSDFSDACSEDPDVAERFLDSPNIDHAEKGSHSQDTTEDRLTHTSRCRYWRWLRYITVANILLFGVTLVINTSRLWSSWGKSPSMNKCVRETSYYSPILDAKAIEFHDVHLNGTLWPPAEEPWSRRVPGDPEAEAIWEAWEPVDTFPITREQVIAIGKDPETAARYPDEYWGMGDDAYIASLDVLHKIHCVNELRKMTFTDYGEDTPIKKTHGQLWWIHLRHCVDMLTQDMLCHADADLITYNWRDTQRHPFPDFGINRKCRSMEPLLEYRNERRVDMKKYVDMPKPKQGIKQIPYEPGYYAMFGFGGSDLFPHGEGYNMPLPDTNKWFGNKPKNRHLSHDASLHDHE